MSSPSKSPLATASPRLDEPSSPDPDPVREVPTDTAEVNHLALPLPSSPSPATSSPSGSTSDVFEDAPISSPSSSPFKPLALASKITPVKSKSKVRAAAAMFENPSPSVSTPKSKGSLDRSRIPVSPSGSFRSIPVSSPSPGPSHSDIVNTGRLSPQKSTTLSRSPSPSPSGDNQPQKARSRSKSPNLRLDSPFIARATSPSPVSTPALPPIDSGQFSDIPLTGDTPQATSSLSSTSGQNKTPQPKRKTKSSSPAPPPADLTDELPEPVLTPPGKEPIKTSFFSSALGFGFPSGHLTSEPASTVPSRSASTSDQGLSAPGSTAASSSGGMGGWRSTMSSLLGSRSASSTSPLPLPPTAEPQTATTAASSSSSSSSRPTETLTRNPSEGTSFILHRVDSTTASRDRRISAQLGGGQAIREGFARVKGQMETAAREMRRERESKASTVAPVGEITDEKEDEKVDWTFWGAVVQDFEDVARNRPKELSKAIQQGIPQVIRGAIWQLMSSSKSAPLEETYKALLKLPSPHEKAINKDLNRTFPNHKYFQEGGGLGQEGLFMVVKAYSLYDPEVGYTQGLAFIVAALLLNMPDEEAFCVLVRLMDSYNLRSHFTAEMRGLQLRLFQFDRLVEEVLPLLHTHLVRKGVKSSIYAAQWFMTLFSYRFPLSLVYRVLDIVFAEGIEAMFRFSLALLKKSEDQLIELEFEQILHFLQSDLFEVYRVDRGSEGDLHDEEEWKANEFVRDAYEIRITTFMLDSYAAEWEDQLRSQNRHAAEVDQLRGANRNLSAQVKQLEASLATMNQEHVELVRQLVMSKIEKEDTENELVRYKMLYAELAHAQQDALSNHSRLSGGSMQG